MTRLAFGGKCGPRDEELSAAQGFSWFIIQSSATLPIPPAVSAKKCLRERRRFQSPDINKLGRIEQSPANMKKTALGGYSRGKLHVPFVGQTAEDSHVSDLDGSSLIIP